jgi:hypothetical protein
MSDALDSNCPTWSGARSVAWPTATKHSCGSATRASSRVRTKSGSVRVARSWGTVPIEPVTSSANTTARDSGCSALSRASRTVPSGSVSGCAPPDRNGDGVAPPCPMRRGAVIARCAAWLYSP